MTSILWPVLAHMGWVFLLYAWLTYARAQAVRRGEVDYSSFEFNREEPAAVASIRLNLANQFELPVIFYALAVLLAFNKFFSGQVLLWAMSDQRGGYPARLFAVQISALNFLHQTSTCILK